MAYTHTSHAYFYGGRKKLVKTTKRLYGIVVLCFFLAPQFEFIKWFCCDATNLPLKCTCTLQFISFHQIPFSPSCELDHIIRFIKHFIASTTCILSIILENGNGDLFGSALFAKWKRFALFCWKLNGLHNKFSNYRTFICFHHFAFKC